MGKSTNTMNGEPKTLRPKPRRGLSGGKGEGRGSLIDQSPNSFSRRSPSQSASKFQEQTSKFQERTSKSREPTSKSQEPTSKFQEQTQNVAVPNIIGDTGGAGGTHPVEGGIVQEQTRNVVVPNIIGNTGGAGGIEGVEGGIVQEQTQNIMVVSKIIGGTGGAGGTGGILGGSAGAGEGPRFQADRIVVGNLNQHLERQSILQWAVVPAQLAAPLVANYYRSATSDLQPLYTSITFSESFHLFTSAVSLILLIFTLFFPVLS